MFLHSTRISSYIRSPGIIQRCPRLRRTPSMGASRVGGSQVLIYTHSTPRPCTSCLESNLRACHRFWKVPDCRPRTPLEQKHGEIILPGRTPLGGTQNMLDILNRWIGSNVTTLTAFLGSSMNLSPLSGRPEPEC